MRSVREAPTGSTADQTMIPSKTRAREMQTRDHGGRVHEAKAPRVRANMDATVRQQPRAPKPDEADAPLDPVALAGEGQDVEPAED